MKPIRVIVAGGRKFDQEEWAHKQISHMLSKKDLGDVEIVEGGALGADRIGRDWAKDNGVQFTTFDADWDDISKPDAVIRTNRYGKEYNAKAGHDRNQDMADYATHLILFWDGKSTGSLDMKRRAEKAGLVVKVFLY